MSTESTAFDAVDTGSAVESQEAKNEDDNISGLEGDNNKTDNDVDEGVDLQGRAHFFMLTTASSWVEGGCPGCPRASTVISQPLDSKTLPWLAVPATQPWAPTHRDIQAPVTLW